MKGLALAALLTVYALVMAFVCVRHARNLIHHLVSSSKIRDQKDIISLLLKEFEENSSDWLWEFDRGGRFQRVSERFATAAQVSREQLVGLDFHDFLRSIGQDSDPILEELRHDIEKHATFSGVEVQISVAGGERFWRLTGKPTFDECGNYAGYIGTASDVTAEKNSERRINYLAHNDALTGLLNRAKFTEHLKQCVARLERYGSPFVVLYLDLDQFKAVNDSRGHLIGDKLLAQVGKRIRSTLREADIAARLGGDEFAIILNNNCDVDETAVAGAAAGRNGQQALRVRRRRRLDRRQHRHRDRTAQRHPARPDPAQCRPRALSGQGRRPPHLPLLRTADGFGRAATPHARSRASPGAARKASSCCTTSRSFRPRTTDPAGSRRWCAGTIRSAASCAPAEFIPIAEQTGLIKQIGDWTIHEACHAAARWPNDLQVAVNLSARHFQTSDIAAVVREALATSKLPPRRLELEITESLLIERPDEVVEKLTELKALGVTIAMDDFGTGYSSLSYLLKFPFDKIKIDKSFVTGFERGHGGARHPSLDRLAWKHAEDRHHRGGRRNAGAGGLPARHRLQPASGLLFRQAAR